jgi:hypothetical protein
MVCFPTNSGQHPNDMFSNTPLVTVYDSPPPNTEFDLSTGVQGECPQFLVWNPETEICESPCEPPSYWHEETESCQGGEVATPPDSTLNPELPEPSGGCPSGAQYNADLGRCVCPIGYNYENDTCVMVVCGDGEWNDALGGCITTPAESADVCSQKRGECMEFCNSGEIVFNCFLDASGEFTSSFCHCDLPELEVPAEITMPPIDDSTTPVEPSTPPTIDPPTLGSGGGSGGEPPSEIEPPLELEPSPEGLDMGDLSGVEHRLDNLIDISQMGAEIQGIIQDEIRYAGDNIVHSIDQADASLDEIAVNQAIIQEELRFSGDRAEIGVGESNRLLGQIATNQATLQDELRFSGDRAEIGVGQINRNLGEIGDTLGDIKGLLEGEDNGTGAGEETMPTVPLFDADLTSYGDFTALDDASALATERAILDTDAIPPPSEPPILPSVTASGQPCISGHITVSGRPIPVDICFNEPWMETGYAIMKIIFIGLAYIQTAILLNKAIVSS